eukprot:CAMPEP_0171227382 /NCGR_PEP_ID=MMETSP0790-20130122/37814_1 /TAXON_ID=2925 /ORGANISM="Alexandrium catenella, Strain OF101" /LENGTH=326 /DNA_ID=CAMNT_0011693485 /DNA_START=113 /DNA_END=1094 /DNA_ORIENTATION=+
MLTPHQAEALCHARPPWVVRKPVPSVMQPARPIKVGTASNTAGAVLNTDDLPEAALTAGGGNRRLGCKTRCAQFWVRAFGLPILLEEEVETPEVADGDPPLVQEWSCPACTFVNHGLLPACEVCGTRRGALEQRHAYRQAPGAQEGVATTAEWPPLQHAIARDDEPSPPEVSDPWEHCEVSSVGSSWLDVDGAATCAELEQELDLEAGESEAGGLVLVDQPPVGVPQEPSLPTSWAARASALPRPGTAAKSPAKGLVAPSTCQARPALGGQNRHVGEEAREEEEEAEEGEIPELEDLQARRSYPQTSRGAAQRRDVTGDAGDPHPA